MRITNPERVATADDLYAFSRAITLFERWTGWNTVCVPELQVRSQLRQGEVIGLYQGPHNPILLATGAGEHTAIHEMCHAADQQLGWVSDEHPELYPATHIDHVTYASRASQVHESFARTCEAGPEGLGLVRAIEQRCGVPLEHPGYTLVLDQIYEAAAPVRRAAELRTLHQEDVGFDAIIGDGTLEDVASGGRLIWMVIRDPDPLLERGDPTDWLTRQMWRVVGWSPDTRQIEVVHELLRRPPALTQGQRVFRLLDSVDDPILVEGTGEPLTHLWRLDESTGALVRLADQPFVTGADAIEGLVGGVVQDGVAMLRVSNPPASIDGAVHPSPLAAPFLGYAGQGWVAVELESGRVVDDHHVYRGALGEPLTEGGLTLTATANGTLGVGVEASVVPFWPYRARTVDGGGRITALRSAAAGVSNPVGVDPDGRLLLVWTNAETWHAYDIRRFLVLSDPKSGAFWVPEDLCAPAEAGLGIFRVMHVDGELWLLGGAVGARRFVLRRLTTAESE